MVARSRCAPREGTDVRLQPIPPPAAIDLSTLLEKSHDLDEPFLNVDADEGYIHAEDDAGEEHEAPQCPGRRPDNAERRKYRLHDLEKSNPVVGARHRDLCPRRKDQPGKRRRPDRTSFRA